MDDLFSAVERWSDRNLQMALATVVRTWGSSPRDIGAKMVINAEGEMAGSVSGGCVESAVVEAGMELIRSGGTKLLHFGVADETAWEIGLACGGEIEIFVQPLNPAIFTSLKTAWEDGVPAIRAFAIRGPEDLIGQELFLTEGGGFFPTNIGQYVVDIELQARKVLERGRRNRESRISHLGDEIVLFLDFIAPAGTLVIVGGGHIAVHLVSFGNELGFRTVIIDPRKQFANQERFPAAEKIIQAWPKSAFSDFRITPTTAVAILTHDPKIDDQALEMACNSAAFYIGVLGNKTTQASLRTRLLSAGIREEDMDRIHGPIGLDLGGRSPAEIALSIMAEIVQARYKK